MSAPAWIARARALRDSNPVAVAALVVANLVPLIGVLFWGWDVATILVLYWVENGIVGALTVVRIMLAQQPDKGHVGDGARAPLPVKALTAAFFVAHYGVFWIIHGVFVVVLTGFAGTTNRVDVLTPLFAALTDPVILLGGAGLLAGQTSALYYDYVRPRLYRTVSPSSQTWRPYPRMVALHFTITLGGVWLVGQASPPVALVGLLVLLKTAAELLIYLLDRKLAAQRQQAPAVAESVVANE